MTLNLPTCDLSIIIVNWNTRDLLAACLESVAGSKFQVTGSESQPSTCDLQLETIVIDNASSDESAAMVRARFPWVRLIVNSENLGFARANNQGIAQAQGKDVLLLNSDTEVQPGALAALVKAMETLPKAGAVGPRVLNPDGSLQNSYGSLPTVLDEILGPYWADFLTKPWGILGRTLAKSGLAVDQPRVVDRVSFACTLIRRSALEQVGLLDEDFEFYSEDYDWFRRLKDAGWQTLYWPAAEIMHHWGGSSRQRSEWALRQLYRSKRRYHLKHSGRFAERALRGGLALRFAAKIVGILATHPARWRDAMPRVRLQCRLIQDMWKAL